MSKNTIIELADMESLLERLDEHANNVAAHNNWKPETLDKYLSKYRSTLVIFFYCGLRLSEVIGDSGLKWKVLSSKGKILSLNLQLPKKWWKLPESSGVWEWRKRSANAGLLKEDIELKQGILYVYSKPLKGGIRETPIEINSASPLLEYVIEAWDSTKQGERVFRVRRSALWSLLRRLSGFGTHRFRHSRADWFARQADVDVTGLMQFFGWARMSTADSYVTPTRGGMKMRKILERIVK